MAKRTEEIRPFLAVEVFEQAEGARVAVTPGIDFGPGGEGYLRFSYASGLERIREGLRRVGDFLKDRG